MRLSPDGQGRLCPAGHGVRSLDLSEDLLGSLVVIRPRHRTSRDTGALPGSNNGSSAGMAHRRSTTGDSLSVRDLARAALDSNLVTGQIFFVNGKNSLP